MGWRHVLQVNPTRSANRLDSGERQRQRYKVSFINVRLPNYIENNVIH